MLSCTCIYIYIIYIWLKGTDRSEVTRDDDIFLSFQIMEECHDVEGGQYQLKSCESKQTSVIRDIYVLLDLELGPDEGCGSVCQHPHPGSAIPLFKYSDIPGFLQGNPWVVSGYRATLPFNQCCRR